MSALPQGTQGREWLDLEGRFLFGKYRGGLAEDVAQDDPSYVAWIVRGDNIDICDEDREVLASLMCWKERGIDPGDRDHAFRND